MKLTRCARCGEDKRTSEFFAANKRHRYDLICRSCYKKYFTGTIYKRECLRCGKKFKTDYKFNRSCPACKKTKIYLKGDEDD